MHTKKLLAGFALGLGLTLALLGFLESSPAADLTVTNWAIEKNPCL